MTRDQQKKVDMRLNTPAYRRWKQGDKRYVAEQGVS